MQNCFDPGRSPLISVIVPVYKVEPYLERCVRSILCQTYRNLEIILVDDGSPDRCGELCDAFAKEDARIRVLHKQNGGLSDARNAGLDAMRGELVGFVDSDDWIYPEFYETLYRNLIAFDADLAEGGIVKVYEDGKQDAQNAFSKPTCYERREGLEVYLVDDQIPSYACTKLFRANLFENLRFPVGVAYEDLAFFFRVFDRVRRSVCIPENLYAYCMRVDSICAIPQGAKQTFGLFNAFAQRYAFAKEKELDLEIAEICLAKACVFAVGGLERISGKTKREKEYLSAIRNFLKIHQKEISRNPRIPENRRQKIKLIRWVYPVFRFRYRKEQRKC